jgi:hypothetical protein
MSIRSNILQKCTALLLMSIGFHAVETNAMNNNKLHCVRQKYQQAIKKEVVEKLCREQANEEKLLLKTKEKLQVTEAQLEAMSKGDFSVMPQPKPHVTGQYPFDPTERGIKERREQKKLRHETWEKEHNRVAQIEFLEKRKQRYEQIVQEHTERLNTLNIKSENPDAYIHEISAIVFPENPSLSGTYRAHFGRALRTLESHYDDKRERLAKKYGVCCDIFDYRIAKRIFYATNDFRKNHPGELSASDWSYVVDRPATQSPQAINATVNQHLPSQPSTDAPIASKHVDNQQNFSAQLYQINDLGEGCIPYVAYEGNDSPGARILRWYRQFMQKPSSYAKATADKPADTSASTAAGTPIDDVSNKPPLAPVVTPVRRDRQDYQKKVVTQPEPQQLSPDPSWHAKAQSDWIGTRQEQLAAERWVEEQKKLDKE